MAGELKLSGPIVVGSFASDPITAFNGEIYYNTVSNKLRQYINGGWQDITAGSVSLTGQTLNEFNVIVGDSSNLSATVDTSSVGDVQVDSTGGLNLKSGVIVDADVSASAAITRSKLAAGTAYRILANDASGVISENAAITASSAVESDANGQLVASATTATELGYVSGVTSAIQTQLNGKLSLSGGTMSGAIDMGTNKITSLGDPLSNQDAATKAYVDAVALGLKPKQAVRVGSTANIDLSSALVNGASIDGVTVATGDRVLVKDQTLPEENGIYIVAASGAASRSADFDAFSEINGAWVAIQEGSTQTGEVWVQYGTVSTLGVDPVTFAFYNPIASLIGGDMVTVSGSTISVDLASVSGLESSNPGNASGQLRVKLEASNPTLQIDGSNRLGVKLDPARAVTTGASGIGVNQDGVTLDIVTNTLKVKDGGISNTQVNASAAIARSKLAALTANRVVVSDASGFDADSSASGVALVSDSFQRGKSGAALIVEEYLDSTTLTDNTASPTTIAALTFAFASYAGEEIAYVIETGAGTPDLRIGTLRVVSNGTTSSLVDTYGETADVGASFTAAISGSDVLIKYTTTNQGSNRTLRADRKLFRK